MKELVDVFGCKLVWDTLQDVVRKDFIETLFSILDGKEATTENLVVGLRQTLGEYE